MTTTSAEASLDSRLEEAISTGDAAAVRRTLKESPDLEATLPSGATPLGRAIEADLSGIVSILIDAGARLEARDTQNRTPLMAAALSSSAHVLRVLLDAGADVTATFAPDKPSTAWHFAAAGGNIPALTLLLPTVSNIDVKGGFGRTALCWAAQYRHATAVEFLVTKGADPTIREDDGTSPREWAERNGDDATLAVLAASTVEA